MAEKDPGGAVVREFDPGVLTVVFRDAAGDEFARLHVNPTDAGLLSRAAEVAEFFEKIGADAVPGEGRSAHGAGREDAVLGEGSPAPGADAGSPDREPDGAVSLDRAVEQKISYLLGYDAHGELFSRVTATTVSSDGEIFAHAVLEAVAEAVAPELSRRAELMRARAREYTAKYGS